MSIPDRATVDYAELFEVERDRLLRLLDCLDPDDWDRDSPCPGWTVLGLTGHLLGDDLGTLSRQRDGHFGTEPPDGLADDAFARWLDRLQDDWVSAARRISPRLIVDLLRHTGPQLAAHLRSQDPSVRTAQVTWAGPETAPVWLDQGRELTEYWIHRQQLQIATRRSVELEADLTGAVLDALRWAYPYRLGELNRPDGEAVLIDIRGVVDRRWTLCWQNGTCAFLDTAGGSVVGRLSMSTDQAWRLLSNNLDPPAQQDLELSGDPEVTAAILRTRAIIGVPNTSP